MDISTILVLAGVLIAALALILDVAGVTGRWLLLLAGAIILVGIGVLLP